MDEKCKRIMDYYCSGKGGDSRNYDLCINSSNLGVDGVVDIIELLVKRELSSREALLKIFIQILLQSRESDVKMI